MKIRKAVTKKVKTKQIQQTVTKKIKEAVTQKIKMAKIMQTIKMKIRKAVTRKAKIKEAITMKIMEVVTKKKEIPRKIKEVATKQIKETVAVVVKTNPSKKNNVSYFYGKQILKSLSCKMLNRYANKL